MSVHPSCRRPTIRHVAVPMLVAAAATLVGCAGDPVSPTQGEPSGDPVAPAGSPTAPVAPVAPVTPVTPPSSAPLAAPVLLEGHVAFVSAPSGTAHIFVLNADGTGATPVTSGAAADAAPSWSPDGSHIAFARSGQGIFVVRADGSELVRLTSDPSDGDPDWSPDGTRIAFVRDTRRGAPDIYVMGADGSAVAPLTSDGMNLHPAWSPDGKRIAFDRTIDADDVPWQVHTMAPDGTDVRRLTSETASIQSAEGGARWSPDGRLIVYWSFVDGLAVMASSGTGAARTLVRDFPGINYWARPRWSPDGQQILLSTNLGSAPRRLVVISVNGSRPAAVKGLEDVNAWDASWVR